MSSATMPRNETAELEGQEFELVLGNKQLLSVFFIVVILLGVFFTMGYVVGRNSAPITAAQQQTQTYERQSAPSAVPVTDRRQTAPATVRPNPRQTSAPASAPRSPVKAGPATQKPIELPPGDCHSTANRGDVSSSAWRSRSRKLRYWPKSCEERVSARWSRPVRTTEFFVCWLVRRKIWMTQVN